MTREELEKLSNIDLVGQLISHAHQFGDVIKETDEFAKELLKRLSRVSDLQKENEGLKIVISNYREESVSDAKLIANYIQHISELENAIKCSHSKVVSIAHGFMCDDCKRCLIQGEK